MNRLPGGRSGVTLFEMLIAVSLTGLVMGGAYKLLASANEISVRHQQVLQASQSGWQTLQQMSRELRAAGGAEPGAETNLVGQDAHVPVRSALGIQGAGESPAAFSDDTVPADLIRFLTTTGGAQSAEERGMVEYALERDDADRVVGLYRRFIPIGKGGEFPLSQHNPNVVAVNYDFMNQKGQWLSAWEEASLPDAVRITLWLRTSPPADPLSVQSLRTIVYLPIGKEVEL